MSLSNSFHSSAKKHAITSAGKLASVERHNNRGYYSHHYDAAKIHDLIGDSSQIVEDTKKYLNDTFGPAIARYNEKQKRADRRIDETPYEYFCSNKSLDIANEAIFQIGDKAFWSRWRTDRVIHVGEKEVVQKSYPENVKTVMNDIFKRQAEAYEQIYTTHGKQIQELISKDLQAAQDVLDGLSEEETKKFESIFKEKGKNQKTLIEQLQDPAKYMKYADAMVKKTAIEKLKLVSRIEQAQMHIKLLNLTGHYDEYSPHAHGVSVCWTSDYKTGLSDRVAKSVVLNPWALTVIQDRLREIAEEEIQKHPEIFQEQSLGEKKRGRNFDYDTEEITRLNQQKLIQENQDLQKNNDQLQTENQDLQILVENQRQMEAQLQEQLQEQTRRYEEMREINEKNLVVIAENEREIESQENTIAEQREILQLIQDYDEYLEEAAQVNDDLGELESLCNEMPKQAKPFHQAAANSWLKEAEKWIQRLRRLIENGIRRLKIFEKDYGVENPLSAPAEQRKKNLDAMITGAGKRAQVAAENAPERKKKDTQWE